MEFRAYVYFVDEDNAPSEHRSHVVLSEKLSLEGVRFSSFEEDCLAIKQPIEALREAISVEASLLK